MGSESRFGKAGVVSLSAQVLVCFRSFAPAHRKLLLSASRQKSWPALQAPAYRHAEERPWERPPKRKPWGWVETGQERSARRPFAAADLIWAQTLRRHPRWAGTTTKSGRRVFYDPWGAMRPFAVAAARAINMRDRERAKFSRNKGENVEKRRSRTPEGTISPPTELCRVDELSISAMAPGDIFLIEELEAADLNSEPTFYAILACPLCGNQALISAAQYFGYAPVICAARACPGFFRIIDEGRLVYLPAN